MNIKKQTEKLAYMGILCSLALVLSAVELMIPAIPFMPPGAKLGLSNIVTMYTAGLFGLLPALGIAIIKAGFSFLMRGSVAGIMSLAGGLSSTFIMWVLLSFKKNKFGYIGIGISGALMHNMAQLVCAMFLTTTAIVYYIPFLIIFAVFTGFLTGFVLKLVMPYIEKIQI